MNQKGKYIVGGLVVLVLVLGYFAFFHKSSVKVGSIYPDEATGFTNVAIAGYATVGDTFAVTGASTFEQARCYHYDWSGGTQIGKLVSGSCYIHPYATTISASSTATVDCQATPNRTALVALPGVLFGDRIVSSLSTTTATAIGIGLDLVGVSRFDDQRIHSAGNLEPSRHTVHLDKYSHFFASDLYRHKVA